MKFILKTRDTDTILDQYIKCRDRVAIITGPLGSGKTIASCQRLFKQLAEQRPNSRGIRKSRWYAVRNTYSELFSTTIKDWLDLFEDLGHFSKGGNQGPPTHKIKCRLQDRTQIDAELVFLALDRPQSIKKIRGSQLTGAWLNEIKELPKAVIDMLDLRIGRYPSKLDGGPSWYGLIGDTNQCDDDHWLYTLAESTKPEGWHFFTQPGGLIKDPVTKEWLPNPKAENTENLPEDYYMKGKEGKAESWINVNLGNNYGTVEDGKPVYKEQWSEAIHLVDSIFFVPEQPLLIGLDFGLTPSAVFTQPTERGGVNILNEIVSYDMGIRQFAEELLWPTIIELFKDFTEIRFIGDPAGNQRAQTNEQTVFKELEDCGILCEEGNTQNLEARHEAVRFFLTRLRDGKPAFRMHSDCGVLRKGFNGGYKFRRLQVIGEERYTSIPDKNKYSHVHDALQYVMMEYHIISGSSAKVKEDIQRAIWAQRQRRMAI